LIDLAAECPPRDPRDLLAEFARTGDQSPFEEIVRRYGAMVYNVCYEVTQNRHDSEDATQAAFLSLAVQTRSGQQILAIGPWLQQVSRRMSLDIIRSKRRRKTREEKHSTSREDRLRESAGTGDGNGHAPDRAAGWEELRHIIQHEIGQLPSKYRAPLLLHYYGGMSRDEMAKELGRRTNTLGVRLHRAREMLGKRLAKRGVALSGVVLGVLLSEVVRSVVSQRMIDSTAQAAMLMSAGHPFACGLVSADVIHLAKTAGTALAAARVKIAASFALFAGGAFAAGAEVAAHVGALNLQKLGQWAPSRLIERLIDGANGLPEFRVEAPPAPENTEIPGATVASRAPIAAPAPAKWNGAPIPMWPGLYAQTVQRIGGEATVSTSQAGDKPMVNPPGRGLRDSLPIVTSATSGAAHARAEGVNPTGSRGGTIVASDHSASGGGGGSAAHQSSGTAEPNVPPGPARVQPPHHYAADSLRPQGAPEKKVEVAARRADESGNEVPGRDLGPGLDPTPSTDGRLTVTVPKTVSPGALGSGTGRSPVSAAIASRGNATPNAPASSGAPSSETPSTGIPPRNVPPDGAPLGGAPLASADATPPKASVIPPRTASLPMATSGTMFDVATTLSSVGPVMSFTPPISLPDLSAGPTDAMNGGTPAASPNLGAPAEAGNGVNPGSSAGPELTPLGGYVSGSTLQISTAARPAGPETFAEISAGGRGRAMYQVGSESAVVNTAVFLGYSGAGVIDQTGGSHTVDSLYMGVTSDSRGLYQLTGGELKVTRSPLQTGATAHALEIGSSGEGIFLLGNRNGTGLVTETGEGAGVDLKVGATLASKATLQGWGKVNLTGTLTNNGQVIADGYGQMRTLDLTSFASVGRDYRNRESRGWYAIHRGMLALPAIATATGTGTYTWGDNAATPTLSFVNSVRATVTDAETAGNLAISLLALDRADVPALPDGHHFIGVWNWSLEDANGEAIKASGIDLTVRYDAALAADLGLDEGILKLWKYEGGQWDRLDFDPSFLRDPSLHTLSVHLNENGMSHFAISAPEPGTIGLAIVGLGIWLGRRGRRS